MSAKVLFVDDEEEIRDLMSINFESMGVEVTLAGSGNEALKILETEKFDAIVSDVKMADGSGVDLLEGINKRGLDTPFIFLTAYLDLDSKKLVELGARKVFYKPTKFSEIEAFLLSTFENK